MDNPDPVPQAANQFVFGQLMELLDSGFSFHPVEGLELEIDGNVYMYSNDGDLEINLCGGELKQNQTIAELNDQLVERFLQNADEFKMEESGKQTIQGITGFLKKIHLINADEEGFGLAWICSPFINQYFYMMVISSTDVWNRLGEPLFDHLKTKITFHPMFQPVREKIKTETNPDLTIEICESCIRDDKFQLSIKRGDISVLLAGRSPRHDDQVIMTGMFAPDGSILYQHSLGQANSSSDFGNQPLVGDHGEICFFYPHSDLQVLHPGTYHFSFSSRSGETIQQVQFIIRSGHALEQQTLDLNFWLASESEAFNQGEKAQQFRTSLYKSLTQKMTPLNLKPGSIECFHPAPDELQAFSAINLDLEVPDCSYMISEVVNNPRALNIGLVDRLFKADVNEIKDIKAISSGAPGMILAPGSPHNCILIAWPHFQDKPDELAEEILRQLVIFCGVAGDKISVEPGTPLNLTQETAWQLSRHPIFYNTG